MRALSRLDRAFAAGTDYLYSNAGYTLLALIIEERSGMTYRDYTASKLLRLPSGATAGGFWDGRPAAPAPRAVGYLDDGTAGERGDFTGPHWALDGNGALAMTTTDLATWTQALFAGEIVAPSAVEAIRRPGFDHGDGTRATPGWVAFDASIFGQPGLATAGGGGDTGHDVVVAWLPERQQSIVIASNTPDVTAEDLLQTVIGPLLAGDPLPTPEKPASDADPADLEAAAGTYALPGGGELTVTTDADRLSVSATGADAVAALFPLPAAVTAVEIGRHERSVLSLLEGASREGRVERDAIEDTIGPIDRIVLGGTVAKQNELRTYVTATSAATTITGWFALDDHGGVAAASIPDEPPSLEVTAAASGGYRPIDPTGSGPDVTLRFGARRVSVSGHAGTLHARLRG